MAGKGTRWDERAGRVTRAFDDWTLLIRDIRTFLKNGLTFVEEGHDRLWKEVGQRPAGADGPEQIDLFDEAACGLNPLDHYWLLLSAALKDAVTAFEVYLEGM